MAKKYRLKINYSEITEDNFEVVEKIRTYEIDGKTCSDSNYNEDTFVFDRVEGLIELKNLPKSWLTEIKEPLTKQEAWEDCKESIKEEIFKSQGWYFYKGWEACLKNQKLGQVVDEKNDYQEFLNFVKEHSTYSDIDTWKAALKHARGL